MSCVKDRHHILPCTKKVLEHDKVNGITFTLAGGEISDVQFSFSFSFFCIALNTGPTANGDEGVY